MAKSKLDKNRILTYSVVAFLLVVFIGGVFLGLNQVLAMEGAFPPEEEVVIAEVNTADQALEFAEKYLNDVLTQRPLSNASAGFGVDGGSIKTDGSEQMLATLNYIRSNFEKSIKPNVEPLSTAYGEDMTDKFLQMSVTPDDIESFEFVYTYATCDTCGAKYTDGSLFNCAECNSVFPDYLSVHDDYTLVLHIKNTDELIEKNFFPRSEAEKLEIFSGISEIYDVQAVDMAYKELTISFNVDRKSDRLKNMRYNKVMNTSVDGVFTASYEALGSAHYEFDFSEYIGYSFTYPGISLSSHEMTVEPKGSDNLLATLICDNPLNYTTVWQSSDESIVTVDDEGYFKATKKTGTATITASYEFNGVTYTDSCEISVKFPVESISVSKRSLTLNSGESAALTVKTNPAKATIKTVKWYSDDENIAVVDENGNITAVSPGTVDVYALSDDGYYKSTCEVTVK